MHRLYISILFILLSISCSKKNNIFEDPAHNINKSDINLYKVNKEDINLPGLFHLPKDKKTVKLYFEKIGARPVEVYLRHDANGWKSENNKYISDGIAHAGIIINFTEGALYQIPPADLDTFLNEFTTNSVIDIPETRSKSTNIQNYTKLIVIDSQGTYSSKELLYLNQLKDGNRQIISSKQLTPTEELAEFTPLGIKGSFDPNIIILGKPIITAAANGQYDRLIKLLKGKANINEVDEKSGDNALIKAIKNGKENISNFLLDNGINPKYTNKSGQNALHIASDIGLYDLSKKLIDMGVDVNAKDNSGNTPIMYAAVSPNAYLTDLLLNNGAKINEQNNQGDTPLALAALAGNNQTVMNLIREGANSLLKDKDGNDILMKAVVGGNEYTVKTLLNLGSSPNTPNKNNVQPLHVAVKKGYNKIAIDLLNKGADVDVQDSQGNTPLILAAYEGNTPLVEKIMEYQPNILIANKNDDNAYSIARDKNYNQIQRILSQTIEKMDTITTLLFEMVAKNDISGATLAINRGAKVNIVDKNTGNTPIFTAIANNYKNMTLKLIELGADLNHKNNRGNTPLIIAVTSADIKMVKILIKEKANTNIANNNGDTPLMWAVKLNKLDVVQYLLLHGADPNQKNIEGLTPYILALNENSSEMVNILKAAGGYE